MKPLGNTERRLLVLVLINQECGESPPTWSELASILGVERRKLSYIAQGLRTKGCLSFVDNRPRGLVVTSLGRRHALKASES